MTFQVDLNAIQVLALAAAWLLAGTYLRGRIPALDAWNLPAPVVGGLAGAILVLLLRDRVMNFQPDPLLQNVLMVAFFTTIGVGSSVTTIRRGGPLVVRLALLACAGAILQNALGLGLTRALGLDPLVGIASGAVALAGGPATALSWGPTLEQLGCRGATAIGVASAMFGIAVSNLLAGIAGGWLIRKHRLRATPDTGQARITQARISPPSGALPDRATLLRQVTLIAIAMGLGTVVSAGISGAGIVLPSYIGAMLCAAVLRFIDDRTGWFGVSPAWVELIGSVALNLFIVMALLTLRLWELAGLALPVLAILIAQVALAIPMTVAAFQVLGRDYEAAVAATGFCGFMVGITANSLASMTAVTEKHGPAPKAFLVVPIVGASLLDFTNSVVIAQMVNLFR